MKNKLLFLCLFISLINMQSAIHAEVIFEKDFKTSSIPETKIIRYRVLSHNDEKKGYTFSFLGKVLKGQVTIQIEDTEKNIIEKREIPAFSLLHWHFTLSEEKGLDNIYISLHLKDMVGNIYSVVVPTIQSQQVYIVQGIVVSMNLLLFFACIYIIRRKSLYLSWWGWGILLGISAKVLFYIVDYIDFLPTTLLINSTTLEDDLSDYLFSIYISLRETAILFLILGFFSSRLLSLEHKKQMAISISLGIALIFLTFTIFEGVLRTFQIMPSLNISPYSLALFSVQIARTPFYYFLIPLKNIILLILWFSAFYLALSGAIQAERRTVIRGILIFIFTEAVLVYFENSYFIYHNSSWWVVVSVLVISFFPVFIYKFKTFIYAEPSPIKK
ncbi:MAG: hypothetical protein ACP5UA_03645 [Candidatus Hydrogenedens sp.]